MRTTSPGAKNARTSVSSAWSAMVQVVGPGFDDEALHITRGLAQVLVHTPEGGAVAAARGLHAADGVEEGGVGAGGNAVAHFHRHGARLRQRLGLDEEFVPRRGLGHLVQRTHAQRHGAGQQQAHAHQCGGDAECGREAQNVRRRAPERRAHRKRAQRRHHVHGHGA